MCTQRTLKSFYDKTKLVNVDSKRIKQEGTANVTRLKLVSKLPRKPGAFSWHVRSVAIATLWGRPSNRSAGSRWNAKCTAPAVESDSITGFMVNIKFAQNKRHSKNGFPSLPVEALTLVAPEMPSLRTCSHAGNREEQFWTPLFREASSTNRSKNEGDGDLIRHERQTSHLHLNEASPLATRATKLHVSPEREVQVPHHLPKYKLSHTFARNIGHESADTYACIALKHPATARVHRLLELLYKFCLRRKMV